MSLDARQRAMLREMGVRVWQANEAATAAEPAAPPATEAAGAAPGPAAIGALAPASPAAPARAGLAARQATPALQSERQPTPTPAEASDQAQGWRVGPLQALHHVGGEASPRDKDGPRWLLLVEQRHDGGSGDGQRLLQAMLRAARLHQGSQVWLAPLQRGGPAGAVQGLEQALAGTEPDLVFIMGRLGAQALLETDEPLGRLRGQVHELWGLPAVVSYDPVTLLRSPADKGKAWDDLCLALQWAREQYEQRQASQDEGD